jgi:hypothetical protein
MSDSLGANASIRLSVGRRRFTTTIGAATLLTATGFAAQAATIVLGPAQYSVEAITNAGSGGNSQDNEQTSAGQVTANSSGAYGSSSALSRATPNQFVYASGGVTEAEAGQLQTFGGVAQTSLSYSFEIVDFKVKVQPVLMFIRANGAAIASGQGSGSGYFDLVETGPSGQAVDILDLADCAGEGCLGDPVSSFSYAQKINLLTNTGYVITLSASAGAFNTGAAPFNGSGSSLIDPYFALASSVPDPGDYTLVFSPGIINSPDNVGSAPEPSTWAMLLLGFVGAGAIGFGRRRKALGRATVSG